jgi:hypothetical protein
MSALTAERCEELAGQYEANVANGADVLPPNVLARHTDTARALRNLAAGIRECERIDLELPSYEDEAQVAFRFKDILTGASQP